MKVEKRDAPCTITITMPSGKALELTLVLVAEGYSAVFTPTEEGEHKVSVTYGNMSVPKSPFTVMVEIAVDVTCVRVRGLETRKYWVYVHNPATALCVPAGPFTCCHTLPIQCFTVVLYACVLTFIACD